jgi:hypothetical protein
MKTHAFDFDALGEALRADNQEFIDSYAIKYPEDGPLLAYCLYFDSSIGANGMLLPQRAVDKTPGVSVSDVASWFYYGDHVEARQSDRTTELLNAYENVYFGDDDEVDDDEEGQENELIKQFTSMISRVMQQLSFDNLPKTNDFIFFADGMDEAYDDLASTVPPALLSKHFGL